MGDGILVAVIDKTTKVLYTTKFKTGEYLSEEEADNHDI
jgi:hypothetical protein